MAGVVNRAGEWRIFKSITFSRGVDWAMTLLRIWWHFVLDATKKRIDNKPRFASTPHMAERQQRSWISGRIQVIHTQSSVNLRLYQFDFRIS